MKIIVYSDVHGNQDALNLLYSTQDYKTADMRICLGDSVMLGPHPNECLDLILNSGDIVLMGNHDSYCAYGLPVEEFPFFKQDKIAHQSYMREKTREELKEKLKSLPKEYTIEVGGKTFNFSHFIWESDRLIADDLDTPAAPTIKTAKMFDTIDADYIIFGHNHKPADISYNGKRFVCVGSLGMNYPGDYVVINIENNKIDIVKKKIYFDLQKVKNEMLTENYPRAAKYVNFLERKE